MLCVWTVSNCSSNVQIPLRDCKKITFVEKEKNPFAEWVPFPARSLTNADIYSALKLLGELVLKAERRVIDDIIIEALVEHLAAPFSPRPSAICVSCAQVSVVTLPLWKGSFLWSELNVYSQMFQLQAIYIKEGNVIAPYRNERVSPVVLPPYEKAPL